MRWLRTNRHGVAILALAAALVIAGALSADERSTSAYFRALRARGLYTLAEGFAVHRLEGSLTPRERLLWLTELSRTYAQHALLTPEAVPNELFDQAEKVLREGLSSLKQSGARQSLLVAQADLYVVLGELRVWRATLVPAQRDEAVAWLTARLTEVESTLADITSLRTQLGRQSAAERAREDFSTAELTALGLTARMDLGDLFRLRAELRRGATSGKPAPAVTADVVAAEEQYRDVSGAARQSTLGRRARLGLVMCSRLRADWTRYDEQLQGLASTRDEQLPEVAAAEVAEQARGLFDRNDPLAALELLKGSSAAGRPLTDEQWYLQVEALLRLQRLAAQKGDTALAAEFDPAIDSALMSASQLTGGHWLVRARSLRARSARASRLGEELAALVQRAESEYAAGDVATAATSYQQVIAALPADLPASERLELSRTAASLLYTQRQFEPALQILRAALQSRPQNDPATLESAGQADLLLCYCLQAAARDADSAALRAECIARLRQHVVDYAGATTLPRANLLLGQSLTGMESIQALQSVPDESPERRAARLTELERWTTLLAEVAPNDPVARETHLWSTIEKRLLALLKSSDERGSAADPIVALRTAIVVARLWLRFQPPNYEVVESVFESARRSASRLTDEERTRERPEERWRAIGWVITASRGEVAQAQAELQRIPADQFAALGRTLLELDALARANPQLLGLVAPLIVDGTDRLASAAKPALPAADLDRLLLAKIAVLQFQGDQQGLTATYQRMLQAAGNDPARLRRVADLAQESASPAASRVTRQALVRLEQVLEAGSAEWIVARSRLIEATARTGDRAEAAKLIAATRAIYGDRLDAETIARWAALLDQPSP